MYFEQGPAVVSRRIVVAPVKAPKKMVPVSSETGAARTIVGVPTFPRKARTAPCPRVMPVAETPGMPETAGSLVVGHFGADGSASTATRLRAACSARVGSY